MGSIYAAAAFTGYSVDLHNVSCGIIPLICLIPHDGLRLIPLVCVAPCLLNSSQNLFNSISFLYYFKTETEKNVYCFIKPISFILILLILTHPMDNRLCQIHYIGGVDKFPVSRWEGTGQNDLALFSRMMKVHTQLIYILHISSWGGGRMVFSFLNFTLFFLFH